MPHRDVPAELDEFLAAHEAELIEFRRDLHAHPELGYHEHRTTRRVALRLGPAGPRPGVLPQGTGMLGGIRPPGDGPPGAAPRRLHSPPTPPQHPPPLPLPL